MDKSKVKEILIRAKSTDPKDRHCKGMHPFAAWRKLKKTVKKKWHGRVV